MKIYRKPVKTWRISPINQSETFRRNRTRGNYARGEEGGMETNEEGREEIERNNREFLSSFFFFFENSLRL